MRIVILHFLDTENKKHSEILKKLSSSATTNGHQVDMVNGFKDASTFRITGYEYVALVVAGKNPFSGKFSPKVTEVLTSSGTASGKKGCALAVKNFLFSQKLCQNLMQAMEKEGMLLDYFDIIESSDHATYVGKKLG